MILFFLLFFEVDFAPFLHPGFLLTCGVSIVALIVWFVRLEAKIAVNASKIDQLEKENSDLYEKFDAHRNNQDIHFNLRVSQQVEQGNERRFKTIENQLEQIIQKIDKMAGK